jgi:hypothetical protein
VAAVEQHVSPVLAGWRDRAVVDYVDISGIIAAHRRQIDLMKQLFSPVASRDLALPVGGSSGPAG